MDELDYAELFGVDAENAAEGAEEQAVTDPAEEEDLDTGEEGQEIADPASDEEEEPTDPDEQTGKPGRTERDAGFAAARRRAEAERDAAIERVRQEERTRANDLIKRMGIKNPAEPGKTIESLEDLENYERSMNQRRFAQRMRRGEITPEEIAENVMQSEAMAPVRAMQEQAIRQRIDEDVRAISAMDPDVKSLQDIMGLEEYPQILSHVKQGQSLADAYKLIFFDKLTARETAKAQQAARNSTAGKYHLRSTGSRGNVGAEVTREELEEFRIFNPGATAEEVRAWKASEAKKRK